MALLHSNIGRVNVTTKPRLWTKCFAFALFVRSTLFNLSTFEFINVKLRWLVISKTRFDVDMQRGYWQESRRQRTSRALPVVYLKINSFTQETAVFTEKHCRGNWIRPKTSLGTTSIVPLVTPPVATYCFDAQCLRGQMWVVSPNGSETHAKNWHVTSSGNLVKTFHIVGHWYPLKNFMFLGFFRE